MHSLKVHMVTMETTFHKINCWKYMYVMIIAEVALLNVLFIIAIFWNTNIGIISFDINISVCMGTYSLLTVFNSKTWAPPPPLR